MLRRFRRAAVVALLAHAGLVGTRTVRLECGTPCAMGATASAGAATTVSHEAMPEDGGMPPSHQVRGGDPSQAPHHGNASDACDLAAGCVAPFIARSADDVAVSSTAPAAPRARPVLFPDSLRAAPDIPPPRA